MAERITRRRQPDPQTGAWFLEDRAIDNPDDDRLDHQAVAIIVEEAVKSAHPPCMIGLLAGFGRGKSSTANIAARRLRDGGSYDTVRVTADKHSGNARARNLVHAIAAELEQYQGMDRAVVREILRPLRQATEVAATDPTDTPLNRFADGRYSYKGLARSLLPFVVVALIVGLGAWAAGASLADLLTIAATSPLVLWVAAMTFAGTNTPMGSLMVPATLTDQKPRAEAADEIEEVFGQLIDEHHDRRKRRLVVFVDDIDRLSKDDLLDALRALRSLQSVPRGREPIFVISCNERIVESAVGASADSPAAVATSDPATGTEGELPIATGLALTASPPPGPPSESEHTHPALAFIDKLLTVRIAMPPTLRGDMRRFANDVINPDHPLRNDPGVDLDRVLAILVHDGVNDPRSVIRLVNRFVGALLLGKAREASGLVFTGDVTHHLDVLAQLAVCLDEFPDLYDEITRNSVLLPAAAKVALRNDALNPSEIDALNRSSALEADPDAPAGYRFHSEALRRYLAGTARLVSYPGDIGPLVYFTATPGGRSLGVERRNQLLSALRVGSADELADVLQAIPDDRKADAAEEIADLVRETSPVDTPNYLAAVAPNLNFLEPRAAAVADACAELLDRSESETPPSEILTALLDSVDPGRDVLLCQRLVRHGDDADVTNGRLLTACTYATGHARTRSHIEPAVREWLEALPNEGGWALARPWLAVADELTSEAHQELLEAVVLATVRSLRSEDGFSDDDRDRLSALVSRAPTASAAPSASQLATSGRNTESAFVRIWDVTCHTGTPEDAFLAAQTAADASVSTADRLLAIRLSAAWSKSWADAIWETDEGSRVAAADEIVAELVTAAGQPELLEAISDFLPTLASSLADQAVPLVNAIAVEAENLRANGSLADAEGATAGVIASLDSLSQEHVNPLVAQMLSPIAPDAEPGTLEVEMACRLLPHISATDHGKVGLEPVADSWSARIRAGGTHDDRCVIAGFRALNSAAPDLVAARAPAVYQQVDQLLQQGDDVAGRLRNLATFPWTDAELNGVLTHLDSRWDNVSEDARLAALELSARAPSGAPYIATFNERIVAAAETNPSGRPAALAAETLQRMSAGQRAQVFVSAVSGHQAVRSAWEQVPDDEAAAVIVVHADGPAAAALLEALPVGRQSTVAEQAMLEVSSTEGVPEDVVNALANFCEPAGLQRAADAALAADASSSAAAGPVLQVAVTAAAKGATLDSDRVDRLIVAILADASDEVASLLAQAAKGRRRLSDEATDLLRQLRKDGSSAVSAFDSAWKK